MPSALGAPTPCESKLQCFEHCTQKCCLPLLYWICLLSFPIDRNTLLAAEFQGKQSYYFLSFSLRISKYLISINAWSFVNPTVQWHEKKVRLRRDWLKLILKGWDSPQVKVC